MRVTCLSEISEAAPHNSASRSGERFFAKARFEKRRNTVCISSFSNHRIGGKDPPKRADAIVRCCLKRDRYEKDSIFTVWLHDP